MSTIPSYDKIANKTRVLDFIKRSGAQRVVIQEKIDGSQFSFMKEEDGKLHFRSKGAVLTAEKDNGFGPAIAHLSQPHIAKNIQSGYIYRAEFMRGQRQNKLSYATVPHGHLVLFEAEQIDDFGLGSAWVRHAAAQLGLYAAKVFWEGFANEIPDDLDQFLGVESMLGGCNAEGIVVKALDVKNKAGEFPRYKLVTKQFKEVRASKETADVGAVVDYLFKQYCPEPRLDKALQRARDNGVELVEANYGLLAKDIGADLDDECLEAAIAYFKSAIWKKVKSRATRALFERI